MSTMITRTITTTIFTAVHYDFSSDTLFHGQRRVFGEYDLLALNELVRKEYAKGGTTIAALDPSTTSVRLGMTVADFIAKSDVLEPGKGTQGMVTRTISATRYTAVIYDPTSGGLVEKELVTSCKRTTDELMEYHRKQIAKGGDMVVAVKDLHTISSLMGMSLEQFIASSELVGGDVEDDEEQG